MFCRHSSILKIILGVIVLSLSLEKASSSFVDAELPSLDFQNRTFEENPFILRSLSITLKPEVEVSPLPSWMENPIKILPDCSLVEIPLPALSQQSSIENFALTVTFHDQGDGGPLVEWIKPTGERVMICSGLGVNGEALNLNARTLLLPYDLTLDGGSVAIAHAGRFDQIISVTIRAGHTTMISALGEDNTPAIIDQAGLVTSEEMAAGRVPLIKENDVTHGRIISAPLSGKSQQFLNNMIEFVVPLAGKLPEAIMLTTDIAGLDLDAQIEVSANDSFVGILNTAPFSLDAPEFVNTLNITKTASQEEQPSFQLAGWRKAWLYLPVRFLKEGDNHLLLNCTSSFSKAVSPSLFLKNSSLDLLYSTVPLNLNKTTTPLAKTLFRF